jgi:leucyl/phenylalanyl-tRNA--protein transferase
MFLSPEIVINAYYKGIFPMADSVDDPFVYWVDPPERGIIELNKFRFSASLKKFIKRKIYTVKVDNNFEKVIEYCSRNLNRESSWINKQIMENYISLNEIGKAKSVECYSKNKLVGGLYGVLMGNFFCGESMFSLQKNSSKVALVYLAAYLKEGGFKYIDTQFFTEHLKQFGTVKVTREFFLRILKKNRDMKINFPKRLTKDILSYF